MLDSVITCDENTESYNKKTKIVPTIFNGKQEPVTHKFLYFACIFINYDS